MSAIYDPTSLGIKPPSGGFQVGGWYSGRQFWNGTLSEPGQIHPSSNQQRSKILRLLDAFSHKFL